MRKNCQDLNASSSLLSGVLPGTGLNKAQCIAETFTFEVLYWAQVAGSVEVEGTEHNVQQEEDCSCLCFSIHESVIKVNWLQMKLSKISQIKTCLTSNKTVGSHYF